MAIPEFLSDILQQPFKRFDNPPRLDPQRHPYRILLPRHETIAESTGNAAGKIGGVGRRCLLKLERSSFQLLLGKLAHQLMHFIAPAASAT